MTLVRILNLAADTQVQAVHMLHPGDVICANRDETLETLLGSCVAIVLTDQRRTVGVMCHIVHCHPAPSEAVKPAAYADAALAAMYGLLKMRGFSANLCDAFVFGGGNMFPQLHKQRDIGSENGAWVLEHLASDGVHVAHCDLGGNVYRRLTWTVGPSDPCVRSVAV